VSPFYHRHGGGNHPHVHHKQDSRHHHHHDHHGYHLSHAHSYDPQGHQPAIVLADTAELGHWHFEVNFELITLAAFCEYILASGLIDLAPIITLRREIQLAPRPPPALS
jgi:hypothetical protein